MLDNIDAFGGNPNKVVTIGHSAGAHLFMMVFLVRAYYALQVPCFGPKLDLFPEEYFQDSRMPLKFVGMAGVYDIFKHYHYEGMRKVSELSPMARAMGGPKFFAALSPSVVLSNSLFWLALARRV